MDINPFALSDDAIAFILQVAREFGARSVFEFGSGRSTVALLSEGFHVVSLENDQKWLDDTARQITANGEWVRLCRPLYPRWCGAVPMMGWRLDDEIRSLLAKADLVLIDSPSYPPFRELALVESLRIARNVPIVLDDTGIPTLARFCDRLVKQNGLMHRRVLMGHGMDLIKRNATAPLITGRPVPEILKGWRRYFAGGPTSLTV